MSSSAPASAKLLLVPTWLGAQPADHFLPRHVIQQIHQLQYFVVENEKSARHFLTAIQHPTPIRELHFSTLNEHSSAADLQQLMQPLLQGHQLGVLSEAGCPAVADPGADLVKIAQAHGIQVQPLIGPSSILLSLMASGLNGQQFCFYGYLPVEKELRIKKIIELEQESKVKHQTQIFIEAPYRNQHLFADLLATCKANTYLCVAKNITMSDEWIVSKTIQKWKQQAAPELHKQATIFLLLG
jgi:16S rRNA (cytidine1402-2'-O)-methyltransferase